MFCYLIASSVLLNHSEESYAMSANIRQCTLLTLCKQCTLTSPSSHFTNAAHYGDI